MSPEAFTVKGNRVQARVVPLPGFMATDPAKLRQLKEPISMRDSGEKEHAQSDYLSLSVSTKRRRISN